MNEKKIQQVLEIEKQAQAKHDKAVAEAEQIPVQADLEAQALLEKARADAQAEARALVAKAQAKDEVDAILANVQSNIKEIDTHAQANMSRAVRYVLNRVVGKE